MTRPPRNLISGTVDTLYPPSRVEHTKTPQAEVRAVIGKEIIQTPTILFPPRKRDPAYLYGSFSSPYLKCPPMGCYLLISETQDKLEYLITMHNNPEHSIEIQYKTWTIAIKTLLQSKGGDLKLSSL
ncbi:hypothetical protein AVEN_49055-1 [Araneus ventricosus]|uniref:Uncharacterized protein n=1 Tax=Araneus ventricosus TaxID=182803 RepID=A0A4Y2HWR3_ARAVE|nr:hypothetical protein AVEN_49055-1 [Araneus ventricosus]